MIYDAPTTAHVRDEGRSAVWNLLFIDGSVRPVNDKWLIYAFSTGGRHVTNGFSLLDDLLDVLETEELGKDPLLTIASPGEAALQTTSGSPLGCREGDYHSTLFAPKD
jgi:hypothetical protein